MVTDERRNLQADPALRRELTEILVGIRKATKTFLTYSGTHPARSRALDEPHKRISNLLTRQAPLTLRISKDGFFHGETLVGQDHPLLRGFTTDLFLRGIRTLYFLPGIRLEDLQHLTELFIMDAAELSRQGGATAFLQKRGSTTVRLEDIDFTFTEKPLEPPEETPTTPPEEIAEEPAETPPPQSVTEAAQEEEVQADLEGLILELKKTDRPARYEHLIQELSQWGREALARGEINPCLRIMTALAAETNSSKDETIRRYARTSLLSLVGETGPQPVIEDFCRWGTIPEVDLVQLLLTLNEEMTGPMVKQLLVEEQTAARRKLVDFLPRMGPPFHRAVMSALKAPSWDAVRRLFPLLVQLPASDAQQILRGLVRHSDPRIRREVIRNFGHMEDPEVTRAPLLAALQDQDTGVRQMAIATLGGLKLKEAVPMLRQIAEERPGTRDLEEQKAAVAVLGAIGDPQALPTLVAILSRKQWFSRKAIEELRLAAAHALGEFGGPEATEALRGVARSARSTLRQACEQALSRAQSSEGGTR